MHKHWLKRKSLLRIHVVRLHTELQASREMDIWRATSELMCTVAACDAMAIQYKNHRRSLSTHGNFGPLYVQGVYLRTRAACKVCTVALALAY